MRDALAALGPYFAVGRPDDPSWRPLRELLDSPEPLTVRVTAVRAALGGDGVERRVAASVAQLGLVARLLAPAFGAAVLDGRLLAMDEAWWRPEIGGPMPLALTDEAIAGVPYAGSLVEAFGGRLLHGLVRALVDRTADFSLSPLVLWGNVASGLNAAAGMVMLGRPDLAEQARQLADDLLALPVLLGSATGAVGPSFRRRSCCLIYRLGPAAPKALCGDCVLSNG